MLEKNFCSSPWFHIRISPEGDYKPCRWGEKGVTIEHSVADTSLTEYLQSDSLNILRTNMLNGETPVICSECQYEQKQGKVSGRQRQLLKSGIVESNFNKTFCSSPHWNQFEYSFLNQGKTQNHPVDLQIDLGNTCNSACIMCPPRYSSRVIKDHQRLHKIEPILFKDPGTMTNWTDDQKLVDKFVNEVGELPSLKYIHLLGGETLYMKSFYNICNQLIDKGIAQNTILGTTTNCTVYDERIEHIIQNFKAVHLGLSIEAVTPLNDYVRWPSKINNVISNIKKFLALREKTDLFISLRITPNLFSVYHLDQLFEFMIENKIIAESCNLLYDPSCLRMELLPKEIKQQIVNKLNNIVSKYNLKRSNDKIINRRVVEITDSVISDIVFEYIDFLTNHTEPDNIVEERQNLIKFIQAYESIHNNNILDYLPEYEEFLRSQGY